MKDNCLNLNVEIGAISILRRKVNIQINQWSQITNRERETKMQAKRVDIVTLKMVKESSILYPQRNVTLK
jgi:hypothetical protein